MQQRDPHSLELPSRVDRKLYTVEVRQNNMQLLSMK